MSLRLDLVIGARPNVMKMVPVLSALLRSGCDISVRIVHTGQHYDPVMASPLGDQVAAGYGDACESVQLEAQSGSQGVQTAAMLVEYEGLLLDRGYPDGVVVFGDVNSTLAATLAAAKLGVPVAHVEAGLRSFDRSMPEEINRVLVDALADLLLTTEAAADRNLIDEGRSADAIHLVGNVMLDSLVAHLDEARGLELPSQMGLTAREFAYVTLHRPPNVDDPERLRAHVAMLSDLSRRIPTVFCVHPRTRARIAAAGLDEALSASDRLRLLEPQPYVRNLALLDAAGVVLTDSGGMQDETAFLGVPCLTLRPNTERPVTIESGVNRLITDAPDGVLDAVDDILAAPRPEPPRIPLWDGKAADRVAAAILNAWS